MSSRTAIQMVLAASLGLAAGALEGVPGRDSSWVPSGSVKHNTKKRPSKASKKVKRKMAKASKRKNRGN